MVHRMGGGWVLTLVRWSVTETGRAWAWGLGGVMAALLDGRLVGASAGLLVPV